MISYLEGIILHIEESKIILKTTYGIGYEVYYKGSAREGMPLEVYTAHVIREQSQELFGFKTLREREIFYLLLSVTGVGPKSAFSLVTTIGIDGIKKAIVLEEKKVLTSAPGIGPKAAAQIILNLKDKIAGMGNINLAGTLSPELSAHSRTLDEVVMACSELGFKDSEVIPLVRKWISSEPEVKPEALIKRILQEMVR